MGNGGRKSYWISSESLWKANKTKVSKMKNLNLKEIAEWLSVKQKDEMLSMLMKDKEERGGLKEELIWFKEPLLSYLQKNYVKVKRNVEMMWYKWDKVCINLPAAWEFKWYKFECFISRNRLNEEDFRNNGELIDKSYSMNDIVELLKALNEYMHAYWIDTDDKAVDFENGLLNLRKHDTWRCLKKILWWFNKRCWLKDTYTHKDWEICYIQFDGDDIWDSHERLFDEYTDWISGYLLLNCQVNK